MGFLKSQKECYFLLSHRKLSKKLNKVCIHSKRNWQPGSYQFLSYMLLDNYLFCLISFAILCSVHEIHTCRTIHIECSCFLPSWHLKRLHLSTIGREYYYLRPFLVIVIEVHLYVSSLVSDGRREVHTTWHSSHLLDGRGGAVNLVEDCSLFAI